MILRIKPLLEDGKVVGAACLDCGGQVVWDSKGQTFAPRCLAEEKLLGDFLTLEALEAAILERWPDLHEFWFGPDNPFMKVYRRKYQ